MKFIVDKRIFEKFQGVTLGVVITQGVKNTAIAEDIQERIRSEEKRIRENFSLETLSAHKSIAPWRAAYVVFGAKPKEHRSSVENLYRLVLEGKEVRHINALVDSYNLISLKHMLPVGGEDLDKVKGDISLTFAGANEPAILLLGDKEPRAPHEGEVIYKDDEGAICRRWNWREAERTKLTEQTANAVLVIEAIAPVTKEDLKVALDELTGLMKHHCGGEIIRYMLDEQNGQIEL